MIILFMTFPHASLSLSHPKGVLSVDCIIMAGIWRETGAHLISCITLVCFVTVAYKIEFERGQNSQNTPIFT